MSLLRQLHSVPFYVEMCQIMYILIGYSVNVS